MAVAKKMIENYDGCFKYEDPFREIIDTCSRSAMFYYLTHSRLNRVIDCSVKDIK
jgi:hypothetical protein